MKNFEDFIKKGEIRKKEKDENLASALFKSSEKNLNFAKSINLTDENAEHIIEKIYDGIREMIEAKLSKEGYKSYSHEATILYLKKFNEFDEKDLDFLEQLRKIRNGIKYYGKEGDKETAKKTIMFSEPIIKKLKNILEK